MTYYTGIDLHRKYAQIAVMNNKGKILCEERVSSKALDIIEVLSKYNNRNSSNKHQVVLEPVSFWYPVYDELSVKDYDVHLANPLQVKAIAAARIKTDKIDAKILAHLLRSNLLPEAYIPSKKIRSLKELLRLKASYVQMQTRVKNKISAILHKNGITHDFSSLFTKEALEWFKKQRLNSTFNQVRKEYLETYYQLHEAILRLSKIINKKASDNPEAMLLKTINGIGYFLGLLIVSEIGDINRFLYVKKLCSYAGICPSTYSSGGKTRHGKITKRGSKYLRWALIQAVQKQGMYKSKLGIYYNKMRQKKGKKIAKVAAARKLCAIIFNMLKSGEPYHPFPGVQSNASIIIRS